MKYIIQSTQAGGELNYAGGGEGYGTAQIDWPKMEKKAEEQINPYYAQLLRDAKGDWALVKRFLLEDYEYYLGKGDTRMAAFLKKVASDAEKRKGSIEYDYDVAKRRTEEDYKTAMDRIAANETAWREQEKFESEEAEKKRMSGYYERLGGAGVVDQAVIRPTEEKREKERQFRISAYNRELAARREDLLTGKERGIEDITTEARRKALGAERQYGEEGKPYVLAKEEYEKLVRPEVGEIEQARREAKMAYANWLAQRELTSKEATYG